VFFFSSFLLPPFNGGFLQNFVLSVLYQAEPILSIRKCTRSDLKGPESARRSPDVSFNRLTNSTTNCPFSKTLAQRLSTLEPSDLLPLDSTLIDGQSYPRASFLQLAYWPAGVPLTQRKNVTTNLSRSKTIFRS
jgi:hypothetical protein